MKQNVWPQIKTSCMTDACKFLVQIEVLLFNSSSQFNQPLKDKNAVFTSYESSNLKQQYKGDMLTDCLVLILQKLHFTQHWLISTERDPYIVFMLFMRFYTAFSRAKNAAQNSKEIFCTWRQFLKICKWIFISKMGWEIKSINFIANMKHSELIF